MRARLMFLAVPILFLVSCDPATKPTDQEATRAVVRAQSCYDPDDPLCLPPPAPMDPDTSAPGYYIGPDYNLDHCTQSNDLDDDGFDDYCEYRVAHRFKPLLTTNPGDDVSGEPYWAARYVSSLPFNAGEGLEIIYLFDYYRDFGDGYPGDAHSGDSEYIVLRVVFDEVTEHWMLSSAFYAAHIDYLYDPPEESNWEGTYTALQYPDGKYRGYPRVWVSNDKHASYISERACDNGGFLGADDCSSNVDYERILVGRYRNIGSAQNRFYDCVFSENPVSYAGVECFWNVDWDFCGWDLDRTDCATANAFHLGFNGFGWYSPPVK